MRSCCLANPSLTTSRLGLGTASLHQLLGAEARQSLLTGAIDEGFTHFDTAPMYGEGIAEHAVGRFLAGGMRQKVTLASKFGLPADPLFERFPTLMYAQRALGGLARRAGLCGVRSRVRALSPAAAETSLGKSLKALQTDWLDILFVHEPQLGDVAELHALSAWLLRQKTSGRVRYLGLAGSAANCLAVMQQVPGVFDILQVEDSLLGREADVVAAAGWRLQITYGYLRQAVAQPGPSHSATVDGLVVMRAALARNRSGMVLVSTRKANRLRELATLTEEVDFS